jgi:hypothetical protein
VSRINNYNFNWDRMTSFEGDTGPYLQYAHVRLTSLTRKNPELLPLPPPEQIAIETLAEQAAARDRVFVGHVPGRCADGAADARAEWGGHVRVPAGACDLESVGDGGG